MKKLKVVLFVLFATVLATAFAACKGKGDTKREITKINESRQTVLKLTDSDTAETFSAKLDDYKVNVVYKGSNKNETIKGSACEVLFGENVVYGTVGSYNVVLKPTQENPNGVYTRVQVEIGHNWGAKDDTGVSTCSVCHATQSETALETPETLTLGDFHKNDKVLVGGNIIKPFGSVNVEGRGPVEVSSFTVGRLTKGASITVKGRAKALSDAKAYYFPIIGIADATRGQYNDAGLYQGTSVFVRNEGWVLLNGVGDQRMLAALAGSGSESFNYGSLFSDTGDEIKNRPEGYNAWKDNAAYASYPLLKENIPFAAADYQDWSVYTEGTIRRTTHYYDESEGATGLGVELTWTYRYDGIIELTIANPELSSSLVARLRVPDNAQGYYDTLIHGDYMSYTIDGASYITPKTLTGISATANKESKYLANTALDYTDITVKATYQQTGETEETATGFDVYGFVPNANGPDTLGEAKGTFYDLKMYPLQTDMTHFKVVLTVGPYAQEDVLSKDEFVTVVPNAVNAVESYPVAMGSVIFDGSAITGYELSLGEGDTVRLAIEGVAGTLNGKLENVTETKYLAMRLHANELGGRFNKTGATGAAYINVPEGGAYADIVIAIGESKTYTVTGLQEKDIVIDLSAVQGVKADSAVQSDNLFLNDAGEIVLTYTFEAGTVTKNTVIAVTAPTGTGRLYVEKGRKAVGLTVKSVTDGTNEIEKTFTGWADLTKLVVTLTKEAVSLNTNGNYSSFGYTLDLTEGSEILARDVVKLTRSFSNAEGAAGVVLGEDGKTYAEVSGDKLLVARIVSENGNLTASAVAVRGLTLNFNAGNKEAISLLNLNGSYIDYAGEFALADGALTEDGIVVPHLYVDGTVDNALDSDYVALVIYEIDLSKISSETVKYFDVVGESSGKYYKIENGALTVVSYDAAAFEDEIISESTGNCYDGALVAKGVKDGGNVVFYAGARYVGGEHKDENNDKKCDLCGASIAEKDAPTTWYKGDYVVNDLKDGEFIEFAGRYSEKSGDNGGDAAKMNAYSIVVEDTGVAQYVMNGDGYFERRAWSWGEATFPTSDAKNEELGVDYAAENEGKMVEGMTNSLITNEHPYNTINGWKNGNGITVDESNFNTLKAGGAYRYTMTYQDGVITVRFRLWEAGVNTVSGIPAYDYTYAMRLTLGSDDKIIFNGCPDVTYGKTTFNVVRGKIVPSVLSEVTADAVTDGSNTYETGELHATINGANVKVNGMATKDAAAFADYTHYVAATLKFSQPLVGTTKVALGGNENAIVKLAADKQSLGVVIPLNVDSEKVYTLTFTNLEGSTAQGAITLDLSDVAISELTAQITNNTLNLAGGSVTLTVSGGTLAGDNKIVIGDAEQAFAAIDMGTKFGNLEVTGVGSNSITFKQNALDFTKSIEAYEVRITTAAGSLLVTKTAEIACAVTGGTTLIDEDTLALADGSLLTLVFTKGVSDKEVRLNANMGGAKDALNADLLRDYDLSFTLKNGKVAFKDGANLLAKKTTAVYSSLGAVALTIDLSDLGIVKGETAEPAYAFELNLGGTVKAYSVNAAREITELTLGEEELQTIVAATCTVDGVQAKALMNGDNVVLWYGIVFVKGEHAFPAEGGLCTVCKEVTGWKKENVQVGKTDNSQAFTTVHGDNKAYNPDASQRYSVIVPGQKVVAEGKVTSITTYNYNGVAALLYEGSTFKEGDHIRIDNWVNNGPDPQTDFTLNNFRVQKTTCTLNGKTSINWETVKAIKANGNIKITWDWSDTSKILVRYDVSGIDTLGEYVQVWTFSAKEGTTLAAKYSIGILPDSGSFTGTITATASKDVVAAEDCNPVKHTHVYAPETDRCECGELNPTHTHNYIDNYCKCGALDPQHEHAFAKGICSICKMVCYHKDQTGANCALCGAELKTGLSFDNVGPGGIGWAYDVPGTLTKGKSMIIYGTHTGDVTEQWQSLIWECKEGYTGRSDAYGWSFGDAKLGNTPVITSTLIGNEGLEVANDWAIFKEIARKDNAWRLEFTWTQEGKLNVLLSYSSLAGKYAGYTYNCLYTFDISRTTQTEWTFHIGGEKVSNITITAVDLPAGDNTNPVE